MINKIASTTHFNKEELTIIEEAQRFMMICLSEESEGLWQCCFIVLQKVESMLKDSEQYIVCR
jgi:hypothetical protein